MAVYLTVCLFIFLQHQGPCHTELHAALDRIASSQQNLGEKFTTFYLPNCDTRGYYKAKQVRPSGKLIPHAAGIHLEASN